MEKIKFNVTVNPFLSLAVINTEINNVNYTTEIIFSDLDEWNTFDFEGKIFDIHYHYDSGFNLSIYPVNENKVDYEHPCETNLNIKY